MNGPADEVSPFLSIPEDYHVAQNDLAFAIRDRFPVSPGHTLVIPRRVASQWWDATPDEQRALMELVDQVRADLLDDQLRSEVLPGTPRPEGFNVGFNAGEVAGQTVDHLHVHVIPRYSGDMDDPRGGVRHVIPSKGNYLDSCVAALPTPLEQKLVRTADTTALTTWLLSVINEGHKTATYKPALLLAILDLSMEVTSGGEDYTAPVHLELADLADKVIEYYWGQTRPNRFNDSGILRQANDGRNSILKRVYGLRTETRSSAHTDIRQVRLAHPERYQAVHRSTVKTLAREPIPRLQRPGGKATRVGYDARLYDDSDFVASRGAKKGTTGIDLRPGVATALASNAFVLRYAVESVWVREVARMNEIGTEEAELYAYLFGAERSSLGAVREGLLDLGASTCFWCGDRLTKSSIEVDHVIPWSHYPNNDLSNLVLADSLCNGDKSARLVTPDHLADWRARDRGELMDLARSISWTLDTERSVQVARSAYRWLPLGVPVWRRVNDHIPYDEQQRDDALALLA